MGKTAEQLKILLQVKEQMEDCHLVQDSTYMFLVQKIGVLVLPTIELSRCDPLYE